VWTVSRRYGTIDPRTQRSGDLLRASRKTTRPDLKQLLFILTVEGETACRCSFGLPTETPVIRRSHMNRWNTLCSVAGRADFLLYVADSKLCSRDNMMHIHEAGGRFVTVMPRSRQEDAEFRKWVQSKLAKLGAGLGSTASPTSR